MRLKKLFSQKLTAITLLETILYLGIFAVFMTVVVNFLLMATEANRKAQERAEMNRNLILIQEHLGNSVISAVSIDAANSTFENANGKLRLNLAGSTTVEYRVENNLLKFIGTDAVNTTITDSRYKVTEFYLTPVNGTSGQLIGLEVRITMVPKSGAGEPRTINSSYMLEV
jgi:type II secretory pathway pseudopilin PulG